MRLTRPASGVLLCIALFVAIATLSQCGDKATAASPPTGGGTGGSVSGRAPQDPVGGPLPANLDPVRLLISGAMLGRLEPCGCASGQSGGLPRRMQHIGEQRNYDLMLEGGDLVDGSNELDLLKAYTALQVLFMMQRPYDALGVGSNDLDLPLDQWVPLLAMAPVVASDLESSLADWPGVPFVDKQVRKHTVRIASFTLKAPAAKDGKPAPFQVLPPVAAWQRAMAGAAAETLRVLMFHGTDTLVREVVPTLDPKPDLVLCFDHGYSEPAGNAELVAAVPVVYPGIRGRVLLAVTLARTTEGPRVGLEHIPLPASKTMPGGGGDPDVKQVLLKHREDVAQNRVLQMLAGKTPTKNGASYIGGQTCAGCHPGPQTAWQASKHANAWKTLVDAENDPKRYGWPVTKYPDCVACHVVGYGEQTGFVDAETTDHLRDVGCERCHGPGSKHLQNPAENRMGLIGGVAPSLLCVQCHDFEQSPNFLYNDKWQMIQHGLEPHMKKK